MPTMSSEISADVAMTKSNISVSESSSELISADLVSIFHTVNNAILSATIATCGIVFNIINLVVFRKQGVKDSVNISLVALSVSDICSLVTVQWLNILWNPFFYTSGVPLLPHEVQHLSGGWPHVCFSKITSWITVFITLERCLCVALPLKVKQIITPKVTSIVLISIYLSMILTLIPEYMASHLDWKFYPKRNRTMLGLVFTKGKERLSIISFILSSLTQNVSFLAVILFTAVLVIKVKQKSKWRKESANVGQNAASLARDKKTVKVVILIAIIYIVCFVPSIVNYTATSIEPEFTVMGRYKNMFFASWSFAFLFETINSTVNIFVYYKISTKYRNTLDDLLNCCKCKNSQTLRKDECASNLVTSVSSWNRNSVE